MKNSYAHLSSSGKVFTLLILFLSFSINAQVGIGNTNPAASSVLDVTSTTQGMLVPRMTTLQRNAIVTPANSLLVYDTDLESFFHFDATPDPGSWVKINSTANERNNYKLVKSAADFPAPVGGIITLVSNTLYEINGTITLNASINLNDAYVWGLDANEDILFRSSGPVFQGTTGGSIRNITITGGGTAFSITGGTSLLVQNTIITGMASVGTISNLGLYFGNIIQFLNNANGITYNNIGSLLLSNQAWFGTNNGTFERFTGTFSQIQKASGFSTVPSGAIGLDVSTNGLAVTNGVINGTVFSGAGTYVNKYTTGSYPGYNFTNAWTVDCPGIPGEGDSEAIGYYYMVGNTTPTNIQNSNTPYKIAGTTTGTNLFRTTHPENNRLTYKGRKSRSFEIICTGSMINPTLLTTKTFTFYIYRNGVKQPSISAERKFTGNDIGNFTLIGTLSLATDDSIEVYLESDSSAGGNPVVTRMSLILK